MSRQVKINSTVVESIRFNTDEHGYKYVAELLDKDGNLVPYVNTQKKAYYLRKPRSEPTLGLYNMFYTVRLNPTSFNNNNNIRNVRIYNNLVDWNDERRKNQFVWLSDVRCYTLNTDPRIVKVVGTDSANTKYFRKDLFDKFTEDYIHNYGLYRCEVTGVICTRTVTVTWSDGSIKNVRPDLSNIFRCEECGHHFHVSHEHEEESYCCGSCGEARLDARLDATEEYDDICEDADDIIAELISYHYARYSSSMGDSSSDFNPEEAFKYFEGNHRFFGVELEREFSDTNPLVSGYFKHDDMSEMLNDTFSVTGDGSLRHGAEFVSRPFGFKVLDLIADAFFDTEFIRCETEVKNTCGLHVHVSRDSMSELTILNLTNFFHNNRYDTFIDKVAGRGSNSYCYREKDLHKYRTGGKIRFSSDKYRAVNVGKDKTVEFRIFRSPSNKDEFKRMVQFVDSLIMFVESKENTNKPSQLNVSCYKAWLRKYGVYSKLRWPQLYSFCFPSTCSSTRLGEVKVPKNVTIDTPIEQATKLPKRIKKYIKKAKFKQQLAA